jgi:glycosyltransferase involved in cell wall biosynthesis
VGEQEEWAKQKPKWCEFIFAPARKALADVMSQVDIWLNCSHTEGLGRMSLEAMSASCGLVVTDTGAEFAKDDYNCLVAPVGSIRRLTEATERLIVDHALRRTLATNAFLTAQKWSDSDTFAQNLDRAVQEIFNGN